MNINRVLAIVLRHIYLTFHQLERFFDVIISPILVLLLFGFLSTYVQGLQSSALASFLLGGIILWVVFEKVSTDVGINFMMDVWDRNVINILASPITFLEFIAGLVIISIIKIAVVLMIMWLMAGLFYNFYISSFGYGFVLLWINLFIFAVSFAIFSPTFCSSFLSNFSFTNSASKNSLFPSHLPCV